MGGSKITADGDCRHEIKRHLLLGRKAMINLDSILKSITTNYYFVNKGQVQPEGRVHPACGEGSGARSHGRGPRSFNGQPQTTSWSRPSADAWPLSLAGEQRSVQGRGLLGQPGWVPAGWRGRISAWRGKAPRPASAKPVAPQAPSQDGSTSPRSAGRGSRVTTSSCFAIWSTLQFAVSQSA